MTSTLTEIAEMMVYSNLSPADVDKLLEKSNEPYHSYDELPLEFHRHIDQCIRELRD